MPSWHRLRRLEQRDVIAVAPVTHQTVDSRAWPVRFEYRHTVPLEETNAVGNVYFSHYVKWQGHCRELFLATHVPEVFTGLGDRHAIVTVRCDCEFLAELFAFDEVLVRMGAGDVTQNRLTLHFDYWRIGDSGEELVARGEQQLAWLVRRGDRFVPDEVPQSLLSAIDAFVAS